MRIVKVGGSLADEPALPERLGPWLHGASPTQRTVLAPGGGPWADQVRAAQARFGFGEYTAHRMAVLAMEQFGHLLAGLMELDVAESEAALRGAGAGSEAAHEGSGVVVWLPARMLADAPEVPASWSVTSDSLAVWLATRLSADEVVLLKALTEHDPQLDGIDRDRLDPAAVGRLAERGVVDAAFPDYAAVYRGRIRIGPAGC